MKEISFPSPQKDWIKFYLNNESIALNILYVRHNTEEIKYACVSKYNTNHLNRLILADGKKWLFFAVNCLSSLLRGITSNHQEEFYCLNCLHSYRTEYRLSKHYSVCKNHDCCYVDMPNEDNKIFKYNHGKKSVNVAFVFYADEEPLLERIDTYHNNPEKLSTTKINIYLLVIHCLNNVHLIYQKISLIVIEL